MRLFLGVTAAFLLAGAASAATLVHDYEFDGIGVIDSVGGVNGGFAGDAFVSGGLLHLDGDGDFVQFDQSIIPTTENGFPTPAFSLYIRYVTNADQPGYANELISQGSSGGPGFYLGELHDGSIAHNTRVADVFGGGTGSEFLVGMHDLLLTTGAGDGTHLYVDGQLTFSSATDLNIAQDHPGGTHTRFGRQFGDYSEYFQGDLDAVRLFSGIAGYDQANANPLAAPEPASWVMMLGGFALTGAGLRRARRNPHFA